MNNYDSDNFRRFQGREIYLGTAEGADVAPGKALEKSPKSPNAALSLLRGSKLSNKFADATSGGLLLGACVGWPKTSANKSSEPFELLCTDGGAACRS